MLIVSTELDEVLALGDRIAVMFQGTDRRHPLAGGGDHGAPGPAHGRRPRRRSRSRERKAVRGGRSRVAASETDPTDEPRERRDGAPRRPTRRRSTPAPPDAATAAARRGGVLRTLRGLLLPALALFTRVRRRRVRLIVLTDFEIMGMWASDPAARSVLRGSSVTDTYGALLRGSIGDSGALIGALVALDWRRRPVARSDRCRRPSSRPRR